jgi:probable F420-dependent oxidoreductase
MSVPQRWGITVPLSGIPLAEHRDWFRDLADLGYTDVWSAEVDAHDAFTPLALAAAWEPRLRLGTAIVPVYTRGPATLASCAATLAEIAPGRVALGIGTSSDVIVERWNGVPFEAPYQRTRDTLRFLRAAFSGEKVSEEYETFSVKGFRLGIKLAPEDRPAILLAALRPGMLKLAAKEADGAITNWLSADDVRTVADVLGPDKELAARLFVIPSEDRDLVDMLGKRAIAAYMNVPVYRAFHEWLGRGDALGGMWDAWAAGDREAALKAIPDTAVDDLLIHGSLDDCAAHLRRYVENGITTPAPMVFPVGADLKDVVRALAPSPSS